MTEVWDPNRIRALRRGLRLTQAELGEKLGYSGGTVSRWENGHPPNRRQRTGLDKLEAELTRTKEEALAQVRTYCEECIIKEPSASIPVGLMREIYTIWCDERGLRRRGNLDNLLKELGFKTAVLTMPEPVRPRYVWVGIKFKAGLHPLPHPSREELASPPEAPPSGPGPLYAPRGDKLASVPNFPAEEEVEAQVRLHTRLRSKVDDLTATFGNAANQYPELLRAVDEYAQLLKDPTDKLDVVGLWSVGGSLHELSRAYYQKTLGDGTLAPPLEPQMAAALSSLVRDHGAFLMGFKEGRDLVERADLFLVQQRELIPELEGPGEHLLEELATNEELVEEETRKVHEAIWDTLHVAGWGASRTTYAAYLTIRNAFRTIIQVSVGNGPSALELAGGAAALSALAGDPNCEFVRVAIPILQNYAAQLLVFFKHSPEFHAYVQYALDLLKIDYDSNGIS